MSEPITPEGHAALVDMVDRAMSVLRAAETVKKTGGAVEIAGVRIEPCDERGETLTLKAFQDAAEARDRVRELHSGCLDGCGICHICNKTLPCPTIRALDGDS